jgi:hypothetical protein
MKKFDKNWLKVGSVFKFLHAPFGRILTVERVVSSDGVGAYTIIIKTNQKDIWFVGEKSSWHWVELKKWYEKGRVDFGGNGFIKALRIWQNIKK